MDTVPNGGPLVAIKGQQFLDVYGTNFFAPATVAIYYNGSQIATLNSTSSYPPYVYYPQLMEIEFDFQGNAGQYAIQVTGINGSSPLFNFTMAAP